MKDDHPFLQALKIRGSTTLLPAVSYHSHNNYLLFYSLTLSFLCVAGRGLQGEGGEGVIYSYQTTAKKGGLLYVFLFHV